MAEKNVTLICHDGDKTKVMEGDYIIGAIVSKKPTEDNKQAFEIQVADFGRCNKIEEISAKKHLLDHLKDMSFIDLLMADLLVDCKERTENNGNS